MKGFRICRIFGIDIMANWSLVFFFGLITWSLSDNFAKQLPQFSALVHWLSAVLSAVIFIFSIVFHEMAHSLSGRKFGLVVKSISLFIFGGVAQFEDRGKFPFAGAKSEFLISIAGPLSSVFLAGIFYIFGMLAGSPLDTVFNWLSYINIILAVFNIIPLFPMDGGRVLRSFLWWRTGNLLKATKTAVRVGTVLGFFLPLGIFFLWGPLNAILVLLIVWFLLIPAAAMEYRKILENHSRN